MFCVNFSVRSVVSGVTVTFKSAWGVKGTVLERNVIVHALLDFQKYIDRETHTHTQRFDQMYLF